MKIRIKKKIQALEEAKTFADTVKEMDGKFTKKLQGILKQTITNETVIEQIINIIKDNLKNSVPSDLPEGFRVQVLNWLKNKVLTPKKTHTQEGEEKKVYSFLSGMAGDPLVAGRISEIEEFYKVKEYASKKEIMDISSFEEMQNIIHEAEPKWAAAEEKRIKKSSGKVDKKNLNIEELQSPDSNWEIFLPHDQNAAMHLGSICFSHWCTSARSEQNMFNHYYEQDDPVFVLRDKTKKEKIRVNRGDGKEIETEVPIMYQVHFGSGQLKDRNNDEVEDEKTRIQLLNLIRNSKTSKGEKVTQRYPVINYPGPLAEHFRRFSKLWL